MKDKTYPKSHITKDDFVPVRCFPQLQCHQFLKINLLKKWYAQLTNNQFFFRLLNQRYIKAFKENSAELSGINQRIVSDLRKNGIAFSHFNEFFDAQFFSVLDECFSEYLAEFKKNEIKAKKNKEVFLDTIHKSHIFTPEDPVSNYLSAPDFSVIASHYMQMVSRFIGSSFWHTREITGNERIYSQQWHRDYNDRMLVKVFLYLNDVNSKNGYFEYISGTHTLGPFAHLYDKIGNDGYRAYPDSHKMDKFVSQLPIIPLNHLKENEKSGDHSPWHLKPTIIQCLAPRGTLIFADTFGIHRGGYVQAGHRNMIMLTYSTNFNIHKSHFAVTQNFAQHLNSLLKMSFGIS